EPGWRMMRSTASGRPEGWAGIVGRENSRCRRGRIAFSPPTAVAADQRPRYVAQEHASSRRREIGVEDTAAPLREAWYYAMPGRGLRDGRALARTMLGDPILLGRGRDGAVFALRDICPHRGMPLSAGNFDGGEIECCYHGWRFAPDGRCTAIPSLAEGQAFDLSTVGVARYPAREVQGNI